MVQLELDLPSPRRGNVIALSEYRRGWNAAKALWRVGIDPAEILPPEPAPGAFALGWHRFVRIVGSGQAGPLGGTGLLL